LWATQRLCLQAPVRACCNNILKKKIDQFVVNVKAGIFSTRLPYSVPSQVPGQNLMMTGVIMNYLVKTTAHFIAW
jgi:hypothetical protein